MPDLTPVSTNTSLNSTRRSPFDEWAADNQTVYAFLTDPSFDAEGSKYLNKMSARLRRRQPLSPEEVCAVTRNIARRIDRDSYLAEAIPSTREAAPSGRTVVEGTVVAVSIRPGFGDDGPDYKMAVDCGYLVWCTVPHTLVQRPESPDLGLTGARVRFSTTLTPRADNPSIATGKAPRSVSLCSLPQPNDLVTRQVA